MILVLVEVGRSLNNVTVKEHNMKNWIFTILLALGCLGSTFAQTKDSLQSGNALIFKDPRIDYLQKVYAAKNKVKAESKKLYRVQIATSKSRTEVNDVKTQFAAKYPGIPVFMSFDPPTFKLRVGTFVSRSDAQTFLNEIRKLYPSSFIVE